jgi:hypothetical protein
MAREIRQDQNYRDRLLKLIPSEIVAAYLVLSGIIPGEATLGTLIVFIVLLVLVPFYLWRLSNVQRTSQLIITTISFAVWVYSIGGGPFADWGLYEPWIASVILVLWTLVIPLAVNPKSQPATP